MMNFSLKLLTDTGKQQATLLQNIKKFVGSDNDLGQNCKKNTLVLIGDHFCTMIKMPDLKSTL